MGKGNSEKTSKIIKKSKYIIISSTCTGKALPQAGCPYYLFLHEGKKTKSSSLAAPQVQKKALPQAGCPYYLFLREGKKTKSSLLAARKISQLRIPWLVEYDSRQTRYTNIAGGSTGLTNKSSERLREPRRGKTAPIMQRCRERDYTKYSNKKRVSK